MGLIENAIGLVEKNPILAAAGAGVVGVGVGVGVASLVRSSGSKKSRSSRRKIKHTARGWKQDRKRKSKQKWEVAYQKRKHKKRSSKGLHYTKKGQPYIILASGKAKFVKKTKRRNR